jgi:hypothetical protein
MGSQPRRTNKVGLIPSQAMETSLSRPSPPGLRRKAAQLRLKPQRRLKDRFALASIAHHSLLQTLLQVGDTTFLTSRTTWHVSSFLPEGFTPTVLEVETVGKADCFKDLCTADNGS